MGTRGRAGPNAGGGSVKLKSKPCRHDWFRDQEYRFCRKCGLGQERGDRSWNEAKWESYVRNKSWHAMYALSRKRDMESAVLKLAIMEGRAKEPEAPIPQERKARFDLMLRFPPCVQLGLGLDYTEPALHIHLPFLWVSVGWFKDTYYCWRLLRPRSHP